MNEIMIDGIIKKLDHVQIVEKKGELEVGITERELQYRFDLFIKSVSAPFAPIDSSGRIKTALYKYFFNILKIKDETQVQMIILSNENNLTFINYINIAKEDYKIKVSDELANKVEIQHYVWNVPEVIDHNSNYVEANYSKSIMNPSYIKSQSTPEVDFINLLENKNNNVEWWFKNGESEIKYFAIHYKDVDKIDRAFYVDFIVKLKNGKIALFDTKDGFTAKETKEKAEYLQKYIIDQNQKHKMKLFGGIIVQKDGSFRLNQKEKYTFSERELSADWEYLNL
jgi:type III restriction enzyme